MPFPILPRNIGDPTAQDARERRAIKAFDAKVKEVDSEVRDILGRFKPTVLTINSGADLLRRYNFNVDTIQMELIGDEIGRMIDRIFLEGGESGLWFVTQYVAPAYQQGTGMAQANMAIQSQVYRAARPALDNILLSPEYRRRIGYVRARQFENMREVTSSMRVAYSRILADGMMQGLNPLTIADQLTELTGTTQARARRIARTEITTALRRSRLDEAEDAMVRLGILTKMMQISALSATTRPTHAARHARLYTIDEVRVWMSTSPNMINCKCSFVEVLVDESGKPLTPGIVARAEKMRKDEGAD